MYSSIALLLGHMVGDYWFQSNKMALNKSNKGWRGDLYCHLHCAIYSLYVAMFVLFGGWEFKFNFPDIQWWEAGISSLLFAFVIAYITHYHIDRYSFASKWMKWFDVVDFEKAPPSLENGQVNLRSFFVAPIYCVIDNSMHLVLMWILFSLLGK